MGLRIKKKAERIAVATVYGFVYWVKAADGKKKWDVESVFGGDSIIAGVGTNSGSPADTVTDVENERTGPHKRQTPPEPENPRQPAQSTRKSKEDTCQIEMKKATGVTREGNTFTRTWYRSTKSSKRK